MKNFLKVICVFVFIVSFLLLNSCKTANLIDKTEITEKTLTDEQAFEFKYNFFAANKYYLEGNYEMAVSILNVCLKIDPTSAAAYYQMASIYSVLKDYKLAEDYAQKAVLYNGNNVWYLYLAGNLYSQNNKFDEAKNVFNRLIQIDSKELDYYLSLAEVYLKENDIKGALKVYNTVENNFGISESISLQKYKILMVSKMYKDALTELINLSKSNTGNIEYRRMIADFYIQTNDIKAAIKEYNNIIKEYGNDGYSHIGLAECYRKENNLEISLNEVELAFKSDDVSSDVKFNMLLSLLQSSNDNEIVKNRIPGLTMILVDKYPDDPDINTIYANNLLMNKELDEAKLVLEKIILIRKDKYAIWEQLILLDNEFKDWKNMQRHTQEAIQYFPNQGFLYFFNGYSAFQLENYEQAIKSLSFGYKLITKKDPMFNDYLLYLGESYYKAAQKDLAYGYFDEILEKEPKNLMVLNNYAYYLSLDNKDLEKAEKMSKITITEEPENATYLDTYAWILFKLNKNEKALQYMEKAIKNDNDVSDVVLEHYGDILFHNNRVEDAIIQWKKAVLLGNGSGLLNKKIDEKTYIE